MLKKTLVIVCLICFGVSNAQETTLDKVSKDICEYLTSLDYKSLSKTELKTHIGLQLVELYNKYKIELNKEGITFDISKGKEEGLAFGKKVGMNMVKHCPAVLLTMAGSKSGSKVVKSEPTEKPFKEGKLKNISGEDLYIIEMKDIDGKNQKFIWLSNFEGSDELIDLGKKSKGKKVRIYYDNIEFFSPKLKEYIVRNKVTKLEFLD